MAVTGSQCLASCALTPGTIADGMMAVPNGKPVTVTLHHPMGEMDVVVDYDIADGVFQHHSAGLIAPVANWPKGKCLFHHRYGRDEMNGSSGS